MKKIISIILVAVVMTSCGNSKCDKNECADTCTSTETAAITKPDAPEGVVKAIECYINGGRKASSEEAKPGFSETATMSWYENGKLRSVPIQTLQA